MLKQNVKIRWPFYYVDGNDFILLMIVDILAICQKLFC